MDISRSMSANVWCPERAIAQSLYLSLYNQVYPDALTACSQSTVSAGSSMAPPLGLCGNKTLILQSYIAPCVFLKQPYRNFKYNYGVQYDNLILNFCFIIFRINLYLKRSSFPYGTSILVGSQLSSFKNRLDGLGTIRKE